MKDRSARWRTVDLPAPLFERLSEGFSRHWLARTHPPPFSTGTSDRTPAAAAR
jgi:hypothetical protein